MGSCGRLLVGAKVGEEALEHSIDHDGQVPRIVEHLVLDKPEPHAAAQLVLTLFELPFRHDAVANLVRDRSSSEALRKQVADGLSSFGELPAKPGRRARRQVMRDLGALFSV